MPVRAELNTKPIFINPKLTLIIDFDCTQATETLPRWAVRNGHHVNEYRQISEAHWQIKIRKG
jgi:TusA-related sulfurtransferase